MFPYLSFSPIRKFFFLLKGFGTFVVVAISFHFSISVSISLFLLVHRTHIFLPYHNHNLPPVSISLWYPSQCDPPFNIRNPCPVAQFITIPLHISPHVDNVPSIVCLYWLNFLIFFLPYFRLVSLLSLLLFLEKQGNPPPKTPFSNLSMLCYFEDFFSNCL